MVADGPRAPSTTWPQHRLESRDACAYALPVAPRLAPGEQVMFQGHPSWRSIMGFYIKGLFVVLMAAFVVGIVTNIAGDSTDAGVVALVAVGGVAVVVRARVHHRITRHYTINHR